ncbi:protein IQ-DOMAIN 32-like [Rutidosis leptorrhynchoides]|uniref:protein IQ-DOMAIN 32-like n=1 Tax=Rutidosis leptorrhynchoides TaxID=125765 RepID=UPI003A99A212
MGKRSATSSCFKIISCGNTSTKDSVDLDDIDASSQQNKGSDKRGWSFRRRSARHRVLSNTVVTNEPPSSSENKEISELKVIGSEPQIQSSISDKTNDNIWTEDIQLPKLSNSSATKNDTVSVMVPETACEKEKEDDIKCEPDPDESESGSGFGSESAIVVIQAAVRRFLAERELVKHKHVVKLQAAVRGHLVRTHAVGTLRCVQAIVKMQALVRARRDKGVENSGNKSRPKYVSVEKLLSNRLARQLMESTPRTKQINIKCDPSKSDSAWSWLERWMSVSSPEIIESRAPEHNQEKVVDVTYNVGEETILSEAKDNSITIDESSRVKNSEEEKPILESMEKPDSSLDKPIDLITEAQIELNMITENPVSETEPKPIHANPVSETGPEPILANPVLESEPESVLDNPVLETEPNPNLENPVAEPEVGSVFENHVLEIEPKRVEKRVATDQADSESRKSVFGSRKASNPAFIAAQSRFEELTSKANSIKSSNSLNYDDEPLKSSSSTNQGDVAGSGSTADISSSDPLKLDNEVDSSVNNIDLHEKAAPVTDVEPEEYSVSDGSKVVQTGWSECGTELSITSTLDSPDQSLEAENKKAVDEEDKVLDEIVSDTHDNDHNIDIDIAEKHDDNVITLADENPDSSVIESNLISGNSELKHEHEKMVPESQGTPSSEISTNSTKKSKSNKKVSSQKRKSWSTTEKSPSRSSVDSGLRRSLEQLPKDAKSGKRRNSFGSPKPNQVDKEGKDSSNSNSSIPSYMQATESAKLKAIANSSPKSSPDLQDKEYNLKKRHSLPGAVNGRQGSPRIQRSMSQALQSTKANGNQERKWQR